MQVYCNPTASFSLGDVRCQRDSLYIMDQSYDDDGAPIYIWNWNFGPTASPQGFFYDNGNGTPPTQILYQPYLQYKWIFTLFCDVTDTNTCYDDTAV